MATVNVYLTFGGNCREAFDFYKSLFGGEYNYLSTFGEMPPQEGWTVPDEAKDYIMHVGLPISKETMLMGSDTHPAFGGNLTIGNNFSVSIQLNDRAEADRLFASLSEGGTVKMPMEDTFWQAYFGICTDKFGINWMINCTPAA